MQFRLFNCCPFELCSNLKEFTRGQQFYGALGRPLQQAGFGIRELVGA